MNQSGPANATERKPSVYVVKFHLDPKLAKGFNETHISQFWRDLEKYDSWKQTGFEYNDRLSALVPLYDETKQDEVLLRKIMREVLGFETREAYSHWIPAIKGAFHYTKKTPPRSEWLGGAEDRDCLEMIRRLQNRGWLQMLVKDRGPLEGRITKPDKKKENNKWAELVQRRSGLFWDSVRDNPPIPTSSSLEPTDGAIEDEYISLLLKDDARNKHAPPPPPPPGPTETRPTFGPGPSFADGTTLTTKEPAASKDDSSPESAKSPVTRKENSSLESTTKELPTGKDVSSPASVCPVADQGTANCPRDPTSPTRKVTVEREEDSSAMDMDPDAWVIEKPRRRLVKIYPTTEGSSPYIDLEIYLPGESECGEGREVIAELDDPE